MEAKLGFNLDLKKVMDAFEKDMKEITDWETERPKKLDALRVEFEATIEVLSARVSTATDLEDWTVIANQVRELQKIANKAKNLVGI